jgi:hypothetical protein
MQAGKQSGMSILPERLAPLLERNSLSGPESKIILISSAFHGRQCKFYVEGAITICKL